MALLTTIIGLFSVKRPKGRSRKLPSSRGQALPSSAGVALAASAIGLYAGLKAGGRGLWPQEEADPPAFSPRFERDWRPLEAVGGRWRPFTFFLALDPAALLEAEDT